MRSILTVSLTTKEVQAIKQKTKKRGFETVSSYLRFLVDEDDGTLISEAELLRRATKAEKDYATGKLTAYTSLKEVL